MSNFGLWSHHINNGFKPQKSEEACTPLPDAEKRLEELLKGLESLCENMERVAVTQQDNTTRIAARNWSRQLRFLCNKYVK